MNLSWIKNITKHMPEAPAPKDLRSFGLILAGGFCAIGIVPALIRGVHPRLWALALAGAFLIAALAAPAALKQPFRVWMLAGHYMGWFNTRVILTMLFLIVFTPVSMLMRLIKRDSMRRSFEPELDTYRVPRNPRPASHLKHQF
jgi:hypothetical protein